MGETIDAVFSAPIASILVVAGIAFLLVAVLGTVAGKIDPGKWGRFAAGAIGLTLLVAGLSMHLITAKTKDSGQVVIEDPGIQEEGHRKAAEEARKQALEEARRKAAEESRVRTIPDTESSFVEKNGHLVSVTNGNPLCPTPPGWRTGCYAISPEHRQNWHNTPDGYIANGKKVKTFSNRGERVFDIPGTKLYFYVDDGHLFFYPTATILCPWPKAGVGKCHKIETKYQDKWRNKTEGFIANGREFDAIEVMRDVRQGLF